MSDDMELVHGSGNVWKDFGYPDADIRQAKTIIAAQIMGILNDQKLSTDQAAKQTGFAPDDFSRILNADFGQFTLDQLIRMLQSLDDELEIGVTIHHESQSIDTDLNLK